MGNKNRVNNTMFLENKMVDERISRAIDNDHTAAMKATGDSRKHMRKKGGNSFSASEICVCMLCKKAFKNHIIYRRHLRIHSEKTFVCHICGKSFVYKNYLQAHMLTHGKHQQFQCHLCHKRFSQKCNLNQHLKFHSTKKPYKCNICEKDFFQQEHLKAHLRHHNNERPFECEICQKSFNIKSSLQRHMNCHTGEKPFICVICNRGYTRRSVLMLHIQQVHENKKPFQCDECQLCFSQKGNLQAHFRRKHLQPKSEHKRGKDKDGTRGKRGVKRQNSKSYKVSMNKAYATHSSSDSEEPVKKRHKSKSDNSALHSYANKVKTVRIDREQFELPNDGYSSPVQSEEMPGVVIIKQEFEELVSDSAETMELISIDNNDSYNSLSENAVDIMCSSSSCDSSDIPDLNLPNILDNQMDMPFDIKSLSGFDAIFDDCKGWDDYLLEDTGVILNAPLPHYDILSSPSKSNAVSNKSSSDASYELFPNLSCTFGHDYACAPPLFGVDDFNDSKDIPIGYGKNAVIQCSPDKKKNEIKVQDKKKTNRLIAKSQTNRKSVNFNIHKLHLAGTSLQA